MDWDSFMSDFKAVALVVAILALMVAACAVIGVVGFNWFIVDAIAMPNFWNALRPIVWLIVWVSVLPVLLSPLVPKVLEKAN